MATNAHKTPFANTISNLSNNKTNDRYHRLSKVYPASIDSIDGSIVTTNFEVKSQFTLPKVAMPHFGPEYIRYPTQKGDKGIVLNTDARTGGVSGLGGGTADLTPQANLASLAFMPVANKNWDKAIDPNSIEMYGPNGAMLRSKTTDAANLMNVRIKIDKQMIVIRIPWDGNHKIFIGGDPEIDKDAIWGNVATSAGPSPYIYARVR